MEEEKAEEQMTQAWTCDLTCGTTETNLCVSSFLTPCLSAQSCVLCCSSCHGNDRAEPKPGVLLSFVTIGVHRKEWKESGRGMCFL